MLAFKIIVNVNCAVSPICMYRNIGTDTLPCNRDFSWSTRLHQQRKADLNGDIYSQ